MEGHSGDLTINGGTFKGLNNHCLVIQGNGATQISGATLINDASVDSSVIFNDYRESSRNSKDN